MVEKRRGNGLGRSIGAFALGATIGSVIALLYAPAPGRATRKRIARRFREMGQQAGRQLGRTKKLLTRQAAYLREATAERVGQAREWVAERVVNGHPKRTVRHHAARHA